MSTSLYSIMKAESLLLFCCTALLNFIFMFFSSKDFYSKMFSYKNKLSVESYVNKLQDVIGNKVLSLTVIGYSISPTIIKVVDVAKQTYKKFFGGYYNFFLFVNIFLIYVVYLHVFNNSYHFSYILLNYGYSLHFFSLSFVYNQIILLLFIYTLKIFKSILNQGNLKNIEYYVGVLFFFLCIFIYFNINNLLLVVFLLEVQSTVIIYLISASFNLLKNNTLDSNTRLSSINSQPIWYFNSLIYQFWVSFIGAVLLIYGVLTLFRFVSFIEWINMNVYFYFLTFSWYQLFSSQYFNIWVPLILGLFLKVGVVPFFFWKPELYKNLSSSNLFLYMTVYLFSLLFLFIVLFNNYFILIKEWLYTYIYIVSVFTLFFISVYLYSIIEIRTFLAYSSVVHISFIFLALSTNNYFNSSTALFYLATYLYYMFFFFCAYFTLSKNTFWFLSDLQYINSNIVVSALLVFFVGLAGIPPFLGFFSKLSVIIILMFSGDYFASVLSLTSGFFVAFFYLQNYRFYGYQKKYFNYKNKLVIVKNNIGLYYYLGFFLISNFLSIFLISDYFIVTNFIGFSI